jgi:hypothetical protein
MIYRTWSGVWVWVRASRGIEALSHSGKTARGAAFHSPDAAAEDLCGIRLRQIVEVTKNDRCSLLSRKRLKRCQQVSATCRRVDRAFGSVVGRVVSLDSMLARDV